MLQTILENRLIPEHLTSINLRTRSGEKAWINLGQPRNGHTPLQEIDDANLPRHNKVFIHVPENYQSISKLRQEGFVLPRDLPRGDKIDVNFVYKHAEPANGLHDLLHLISQDTVATNSHVIQRHPEHFFEGLDCEPREVAFEFNMFRIHYVVKNDHELHVWYEFDH